MDDCSTYDYGGVDMPWIKMEITEEIKNCALELGEKHYQYAVNNNINITFSDGAQTQKDTHITGKMGECLFNKLLKDNEISYSWNQNFGSHFKFNIDNKLYDIRTGNRKLDIEEIKPNYNFFIPCKYVERKIDYFIHILIDREEEYGYITGCISKEEAKLHKPIQTERMKYPAHIIPFNELPDIRKTIPLKGIGYTLYYPPWDTGKQGSMFDYFEEP